MLINKIYYYQKINALKSIFLANRYYVLPVGQHKLRKPILAAGRCVLFKSTHLRTCENLFFFVKQQTNALKI